MTDFEVLENELIRLHELLILPNLDSETRDWACRSIEHILSSLAPIPVYNVPFDTTTHHPIFFD